MAREKNWNYKIYHRLLKYFFLSFHLGMGQGDKYEDNCLDVYHYFNTSCFSGYGDDEKVFELFGVTGFVLFGLELIVLINN